MKRNIPLLYVHNFLTDFRMHFPFLVIFLAQVSGSYTVAMALLSLIMITSALFEIPTGVLSDKIGRKGVILLGSFFSAAGIASFAFSESVLLLCLGAVFCGLSTCLFSGNNDALLFETLKAMKKDDAYHYYLGRAHSMFQMALASSALLGGFLAAYDIRLVFLVSIIPQVVAAIVSCFLVEPKRHYVASSENVEHVIKAFKAIWHNPRLLRIVIAQGVSGGVDEAGFQFQSVFVNALWPIWAVGLYRSLNHGLASLGFWFSGRIIDWLKEVGVLVVRDVYWFVSQVLAVLLYSVVSPLIILSCACFFGPATVATNHLMQKDFTDEQRATMGSISSLVTSFIFAVASLCIGAVADAFGASTAVLLAVFVAFLALPIYMGAFKTKCV